MASWLTRKRRRINIFSGFFLLVNVSAILLLLFGYAAAYVPPDKYWIFGFGGLIFPYIVFANAFFVLFWIVLKRRLFLLSLIVMIICAQRLSNYVQVFSGSSEAPSSSLKIISYNVQIFDLYNWKNNRISDKGTGILNYFKESQPEILCMQEFHAGIKRKVDIPDSIAELANLKHRHIAYVQKDDKALPYGIATFSKWPIINKGVVNFQDNSINFCIYSDIVIEKDTVRLFNVHLESIRFSKEDYFYVSELQRNTDSQELFSESSKKILRKFKRAFISRAPQARKIKELIHESPYPVILCGDFNDTPSSYTYAQISSNLSDAFKESGNGLGTTYAGTMPSFRIDYILHDKEMESFQYQTIRNSFSDHYPITTQLLLSKNL